MCSDFLMELSSNLNNSMTKGLHSAVPLNISQAEQKQRCDYKYGVVDVIVLFVGHQEIDKHQQKKGVAVQFRQTEIAAEQVFKGPSQHGRRGSRAGRLTVSLIFGLVRGIGLRLRYRG